MIQLPIRDRRKCPPDAQVRGVIIGKLRRNVDSSLGALVEFCKCASISNGIVMNRVMRSGKFNGWLGYSGARISKPVNCTIGVFVSASDSVGTNLQRISLLAEALGISSQCYLLYEEAKIQKTPIIKKALFRLNDDEVMSINPQAMIIGLSRVTVSSWSECLPRYIHYIKTSMPFGESIAHKLKLPAGYERCNSLKCCLALKTFIENSGLDRYSIYIEYDPTNGGLKGDAASGGSEEIEPDGGIDYGHDNHMASAVTARRFRHFVPDVSVW